LTRLALYIKPSRLGLESRIKVLLAMGSFECSEPILNVVRLSLTRAMNPDLTLPSMFPGLFTSEKQLAEELGGKTEEICTLKHDLNALQGQLNNKRRRPARLEDECKEVSHRLVAVQKEILGEQVPPIDAGSIETSCKVCHSETGGTGSGSTRLPPGPPIT